MIGACLKIRRGPAAGDFGPATRDGEFRASSMRKKAEQPWEYARKGVTESVLFRLFSPFYGFSRLTGLNFIFAGSTARKPRWMAGGRGVECGMEEERHMKFLIADF